MYLETKLGSIPHFEVLSAANDQTGSRSTY